MLIDAIKDIKPNGTSNWEAGFNAAFHTFEKSRLINQTTNCQKAVVLFTDETGQPVGVSFFFTSLLVIGSFSFVIISNIIFQFK